MTERELVERTRKALEEYAKLPPEERFRRLVEIGTINEQGEVLLGLEEARALEAAEAVRQTSANGEANAKRAETD